MYCMMKSALQKQIADGTQENMFFFFFLSFDFSLLCTFCVRPHSHFLRQPIKTGAAPSGNLLSGLRGLQLSITQCPLPDESHT